MTPRSKKTLLLSGVAAAVIGVAVAGGILLYRAMYVDLLGVVEAGKVYRSAQPRGMQWRVLQRYGIKTVINLRPRAENPRDFENEIVACKDGGAEMLNLPLSAFTTIEDIEQFLRMIRHCGGPVLVHCEYGKVRTGDMIAAYRIVVNGWPIEKAWAEIVQFDHQPYGKRLENLKRMYADLSENRQQWLDRTAPPTTQP